MTRPEDAIYVSEIIMLVFEELEDDKPTLAHSARCCRVFLEPALDILYRFLPTSDPLEKLIPDKGLLASRHTTGVRNWIANEN